MAFLALLGVFVALGFIMRAQHDAGRLRERQEASDSLIQHAKQSEGELRDRLMEAAISIRDGLYRATHTDEDVNPSRPSPYDFSEVGRGVYQVKLGSTLKGIVVLEGDEWLAYSMKNTQKPVGTARSREEAAELLEV